MGVNGSSRGAGIGGVEPLSLVVRVVPDLPTFSVDTGFAYRVPPDLASNVSVGSIVRVPLGGRKVRGFVVEVSASSEEGLKEVRSISGAWPAFTAHTLQTLSWAATHYVAPLSVLLGKTTPPNLPRKAGLRRLPSVPPASSPVPEATAAAAKGSHSRATQILAGTDWPELMRRTITDVVKGDRSVMIVAPTAVEARSLADELGGDFGARIVEVADQSDARLTTAWSVAAAQPGMVVIGTPRVIWWPIRRLAMIVLVEDGRRGMKERQTPAVAAASIARRRSEVERFPVVHIGRVPTADALAGGIAISSTPGRLWPLVEVVDRSEEPPGGGVVTQRARAAIAGAVGRDERVLVFTHRHGYAPASRCGACRELRSCAVCGARPDPGTTCARCGADLGPCRSCGGRRFEPLGAAFGRVVEELRRVVGSDVGGLIDGRLVTVAAERDLVGLAPVDLSVAVDADGLVRGTNYRAAEDAVGVAGSGGRGGQAGQSQEGDDPDGGPNSSNL